MLTGLPRTTSTHRVPIMTGPPRRVQAIGTTVPARAETTESHARSVVSKREHPRVCGDDPSWTDRSHLCSGTPPRARGRPRADRERRMVARNTPARAGTTPRASRTTWCPREHPRVCGDDARSASLARPRGGTPPRVRGRPTRLPSHRPVARNTPARAGTTLTDLRLRCAAVRSRIMKRASGGCRRLTASG
jgi:hypothetical protein